MKTTVGSINFIPSWTGWYVFLDAPLDFLSQKQVPIKSGAHGKPVPCILVLLHSLHFWEVAEFPVVITTINCYNTNDDQSDLSLSCCSRPNLINEVYLI